MEWFALAILVLLTLVGFTLNFFTGIGTLIMLVGAVVYTAITSFEVLSLKTLLVLGVLYACGEAFESVSSVVGTKRMGGSNKAAIGGVIGGLVGAALGTPLVPVPLIGTFLGLALGLFLGAALVEFILKKDIRQSVKAGVGSLLGRMASIAFKTVIAVSMLWLTWSTITRGALN